MPTVEEVYFRKDTGEPLYLTPYIDSGDIETGRQLSAVVDPLDGIENDPFESYSGFITVRPDSHMFFWFTPAMVSRIMKYFVHDSLH